MKMMLIILGLFLMVLGIVVVAAGIVAFSEGAAEPKGPQPWTLVYDGRGKYSYIGFDGRLADQDFATQEEAKAAADKSRQWHADYAAGKFADEIAQRAAADLSRAQAMKPLDP